MSRDKKLDKIDGWEPQGMQGGGKPTRGLRTPGAAKAGIMGMPMPPAMAAFVNSMAPAAPVPEAVVDERTGLDKKYDIRDRRAHVTSDGFHSMLCRQNLSALGDRVDVIEIRGALAGTVEFILRKKNDPIDFFPDEVGSCSLGDIRKYGLTVAMAGQSKVGVVLGNKISGLLRRQNPAQSEVATALGHMNPPKEVRKLSQAWASNFRWIMNKGERLKRLAESVEALPDGHALKAKIRYNSDPKSHFSEDEDAFTRRVVAQAYHPIYARTLGPEFNSLVFDSEPYLRLIRPAWERHSSFKKANKPNLLFPDNKPAKIYYGGQPVIILTPPDFRPLPSPQSPGPVAG